MLNNNRLPGFLKSTFWSTKLSDLDTQRDKAHIINQILAYGGIEELRWLFSTYPREDIKKSFVMHPAKVYRFPTFHFVKDILLGIADFLHTENYVVNTPRVIGQK